MKKVLISVLSVLLLAFLVGCQETNQESKSDDSSGDSSSNSSNQSAEQQQALEDAQREVTRAREEAEQARDEAEAAPETDETGAGDDSTDTASEEPSEDTPELSPSETLGAQYDYMGSGQYDEAYYMLAEQSQRLVSLEQYAGFFPDSYEVSEYSVNSEQIDGDAATVQADLVVSDSERGVQQYPVTQEFVLVDGEWKIILRDEQIETFAAVQTPEESPPEDESSSEPAVNTIPGDGTFIVGEDIQPGTYETEGSDSCYWERLSGTSGTMEDVITNGLPTGPATITISPSDEAFLTQGCSEWTLR